MTRRGFTLVEVAVAVAVLATAGVALERLLARSLRTIDLDAHAARTLAAARTALAEAAIAPPPVGSASAVRDGIRTTRVVTATRHPWLREVTVRTETADGAARSELVEIVYAPPR
jgi:prepilin-type N-terminal cleavage/methylation domain-containing protein